MAKSRMDWHGTEVKMRIGLGMERNLTKAAIFVQRAVKESLKTAGPTKTHPDMPASSAGNPPHLRTGHLARSISYEVDKTSARVGTNVEYARALELGYAPRNLAARPYLRPAVYKNQSQIKKILTGKIK